MRKILDFFINHWIRFTIAFVIGASLILLYCGVTNTWSRMIGYCNGSFIAAFVLISFSALTILNLFGAFDIFSYYPSRKKKENGLKENLFDYSTRKKQERSKFKLVFVPYLAWGVLFLIASVILYILL